jgi:hypothetical protein
LNNLQIQGKACNLGSYFIQLETLSKIRNLESIVEPIINTMTSIYEAILKDHPASTQDPVVKLVLGEQINKEKELARAEGEARGEACGEAKGKAEAIADLLCSGLLSPEQIAQSLRVPLAKVLEIRDGLD